MLGAIIGDIAGSRFEHNNNKTKEFEIFSNLSRCTDDSIMSIAVAHAIMDSKKDQSVLDAVVAKYMRDYGRKYPGYGYGGTFSEWINDDNYKPYNSFGNGAAMRVSACGFAASTTEEAKILSKIVTEVSHNHPEGLKGAESVAVAIFMAKTGKSKLEINEYIIKNYYPIDFTIDGIREEYTFDVSCQGSVPQAFQAFFEATSFEDTIRNAVSIGGDSDTIAAIAGSLAEAYYGIPDDFRERAFTYLDSNLRAVVNEFESIFTFTPADKQAADLGVKKTIKDGILGGLKSDIVESDEDTEKVTATKLKSHLYKCCDILRGPVSRGLYKNYVIPIVFFKRISDVYDEEYAEASARYGGNEFAISMHKFSFSIPEGCHWNDLRKVTKDVGTYFSNAVTKIEQANPDSLSGVFSGFDEAQWTNKEIIDDNRMINLVEHISKMKMGNNDYSADVMGDTYEYLLKEFSLLEKQNGGQFYTPRNIVKLMVQILDPQKGDSIYDPACGTGGMLIEAIRQMKAGNYAYGKIFGQEKLFSTSSIARMNLYLHGAREFNVAHGDTLRSPAFIHHEALRKFDKVLANPPFGLEKWGAAGWEHDKYGRNVWYNPTDSSADWAWIQHIVASMEPEKGKSAFIMAQGVLFHSGAEAETRRKLIETDKVEYVIALPGGVFFGAGVSGCIIVLNNRKPAAHKGKILLVDASECVTVYRAQKVMEDNNIDEVYSYITGYYDVVDRCKVVTIDELSKKDYSLSPNAYVEKTPPPPIDTEVIKKKYFEAVKTTKACEMNLMRLLKEGGYIDE